MFIGRFAVVLLACFSQAAFSQTSLGEKPLPSEPAPRWTLLIDPVCPVSSFYSRPFPNATKDLRVLYFPSAKEAKLKNPESLSLNVGFNSPRLPDHPISAESAVIPFTRKENYWEAVVSLEKRRMVYAILAVQDDKSDAVDDNNGEFWDVVFCDPIGQKDANAVRHQAQSYAGGTWSPKLGRKTDYNKAVAILEEYLSADASHSKQTFLAGDLWQYRAERDGGDAQAYANLAKEIDKYLADHADNKAVAGTVRNFVIHHYEQLPSDFLARIVSTLDEKRNDPRHSVRAELAYIRALHEIDPEKELAALDDFVAKYPESIQVEFAELSRLNIFAQRKDVSGAEAALTSYRGARAKNPDLFDPNSYNFYLTMAQLYIEKGVKLDEALKLVDEAVAAITAGQGPHLPSLPQEFTRQAQARCEETGARAYLALHKPDLAVAQAEKALAVLNDTAEAHFVLAKAYASAGDKQKALEEYFQAALMPSNDDLMYRAELEHFYRKNSGNKKQFEAALNKHIADRFQATHYIPKLINQSAPTLEFTTLKGEKFGSAELSGKTVVVNFWSPG
jgi:tetratricopeptide (TPR) repeat protein